MKIIGIESYSDKEEKDLAFEMLKEVVEEEDGEKAVKFLEFTTNDGKEAKVAVYEGESDEDAINRAFSTEDQIAEGDK